MYAGHTEGLRQESMTCDTLNKTEVIIASSRQLAGNISLCHISQEVLHNIEDRFKSMYQHTGKLTKFA